MTEDRVAYDEEKLLAALSRGDHKAFDCIFRKYYVDVVMFCSRFMDRIEDLSLIHI